jgi:hypothetical protein
MFKTLISVNSVAADGEMDADAGRTYAIFLRTMTPAVGGSRRDDRRSLQEGRQIAGRGCLKRFRVLGKK